MAREALPKMNVDRSETGCCPRFDPTGWDNEDFIVAGWPFVRVTTRNFWHIPLNMGPVLARANRAIQQAGAGLDTAYLILSTDPSPWRGEHLLAVARPVDGQVNVTLDGTFLTKVYEGPYRNAGAWARDMQKIVKSTGRTLEQLYFFYTTCPKCARHFGKNYVVAFAQV